MSQPDELWRKLTAAARQAPAPADETAPYGFAARVAARGMSGRRTSGSLVEQFALRALGFAGLAAALALVTHFSVPASAQSDEASLFSLEDPAAIVLGVNADE
ncbi:MAG: hypothetical protein RIS54_525 [Verrucomicrobiota bacterium]|jgi:hypothetical protein